MNRPARHSTLGKQSMGELFTHAQSLCSAGRYTEADPIVRRLLAGMPASAPALNLASVVAYETGRFEHAVRLADRAIRLAPDYALTHANRGRALTELGSLDEAIAAYSQALRLDPQLEGLRNGLAFALRCASRLEEAEREAREALRRSPHDDSLHTNLGCMLYDMGRPQDAIACFEASLRQRPGNAAALHNRGMALLLDGALREGWRDYELRWHVPPLVPRGFSQKQWMGEPLEGRTLLVHHEQGFGDTIQFCRFVRSVGNAGRVILEVPKPLVRLAASLGSGFQIVSQGDALPPFDLHCPMLSLPSALNIGIDTIPSDVPYLGADPGQIEKWRSRLASHAGLHVGLVWAGSGTLPSVDRKRSVPFQMLRRLLEVPGVTFVSLQKDAAVPISRGRVPMVDWTRELRDFADTAALIEALDLVISVDTSVAHLAGALGKPVWVLNRFETCWRWLLHRDDSPWYPSLRLFRQTRPGDWSDVIGWVESELRLLTAQERG